MNLYSEFFKIENIIYSGFSCLAVVLGLYFQSAYPWWLQWGFALFALLILFGNYGFRAPSLYQRLYIFAGIFIALVLPALFSPMPMSSLSDGFIILFGLLVLISLNRSKAYFILGVLVFYVFADSVVGVVDMFFNRERRILGLFDDYNLRATFYLISILLIFWLVQSRYRFNIGIWFLVFYLSFNFHTAVSRFVSMLALGAIFSIYLYELRWKQHYRQVVVLLAVFVLSYLLFLFVTQFSGMSDIDAARTSNVGSLNGRIPLWEFGLSQFFASPLTGYGLGLFSQLYAPVRVELGTGGYFIHNDFIEFMASSGIIGFIYMFLPMVWFARTMWQSWLKGSVQQYIFSLSGLVIIGFSILNFYFWRFENLLIFAAIWRLSESANPVLLRKSASKKCMFFLIIFVPLISFGAGAEVERILFKNLNFESMPFDHWTSSILGAESRLLPAQTRALVSEYKNNLTQGLGVDSDFTKHLSINSDFINSAVDQNTLNPEMYCARAELGLVNGESLEQVTNYLNEGHKRNRWNVYCRYTDIQMHVWYGETELGINRLVGFFERNRIKLNNNIHSYIWLAQQGELYASYMGLQKQAVYLKKVQSLLDLYTLRQ